MRFVITLVFLIIIASSNAVKFLNVQMRVVFTAIIVIFTTKNSTNERSLLSHFVFLLGGNVLCCLR